MASVLYRGKRLRLTYFARGKRSKVYTSNYKNEKLAVKVKHKSSKSELVIKNEARWLKYLNKHNIGPKLIDYRKDYVIYKFVNGKRITEWLRESKKKNVVKVLKKILLSCKVLDKLGINKEELHNPYKHILIGKEIKMIDFERCHKTSKPKNVTQFCQFLRSAKIDKILKAKGINIPKERMREILASYKRYCAENKHRYAEGKFKDLLELL